MKIPSLNALRAFEAAARHQSLSRAGDELNVTHAAISHQLRNLEDWFGAPLMARYGRRIRLTQAGEALSARLSPVFEDIEQACNRVLGLVRKGALTVGCVPSIASRWLIPKLPEFGALHPDVEIRVVYAHTDERLRSGNLDVLITHREEIESGTRAKPVFSRLSKPVCSPGYFQSRGPIVTPEDIARSTLLHDESQDGWKRWFNQAGLQRDVAIAGPIYQDFNLMATAVVAGHGVALCPIYVVRTEIMRGDVVILSDIGVNQDNYYVIKTTEETNSLVDEFVNWFCISLQL